MVAQKIIFICILLLCCLGIGFTDSPKQSENKEQKNMRQLIIRTDDIGFCHGVNMAFKRAVGAGMVTSASVIVNTPWLDEAVEILKQHPEISVGVHLALNSEWREFKWGPVSPYDKVASLVDPFGKFYGSRKELFSHKPKLNEVAKELRAQVDLAKRKGLNVTYIDNHMSAAISTLEFQQEMEKMANDYNIGISRYFGEQEIENVYRYSPETKLEHAIQNLDSMTTSGLYLMVFHIGTDDPEMQAMTDLNSVGLSDMSKHRQAEGDVLCSPEFKSVIQAKHVQLIGYQQLKENGLDKMNRPFVSDSYEEVVKKALEK